MCEHVLAETMGVAMLEVRDLLREIILPGDDM